MGNLLSFLTGLSGGSAEAIDQERKQAQQEQEQELAYRRTNLEHMVKAAEEGRVNPEMVGRVYEEYMNSMQGLSGRPMAKGRAGFTGKKDLGQNSLLRDLASNAVGLFGPQPGALNIDWNAAKPQEQVGGPTGMAGVPSIPNFQTPGRPLEQVVNEGYQNALPQGGGNWLMKHPDALAMEQEQQGMLKSLVGTRAGNALEVGKQQELYGKQHPYEDRYDGKGGSSMSFTSPTWMFHPTKGNFQVAIDKESRQHFVVGTNEPVPEGSVPVNQLSTYFNDAGAGQTIPKGTATPVASLPPGTGRTTAPRVPLTEKREGEEVKLTDKEVSDLYNNIEQEFTRIAPKSGRVPPDRIAALWQQAYEATTPQTVRDQYPTIEKFRQRRYPRVVATPTGGATTPVSDDEMVKKLAEALAAAAQKK